ncbi:crossover junction endonuclease MUS81 isoform X2 [Bombyx mandarina]|uniref:Crossover junction endonuclease MUS81 n=1 Tax=Bombyx mandarina TaxID=7092 RepID=A0A6J2KL87_BOMMA|nr:crossover junction endonuclease MUS81 isoform X2 [Bombyx mandarina]
MNTVGNRITYKRKRPNPMFQEWLEELHEEAKEKGSKLEPMLREALDSLSKYPLPLNSGAECAILRGFQKKLCIFLDKRLEVYNSNLNDCKDEECIATHGETLSEDSSSEKDLNLHSSDDDLKDKNKYLPLELNVDTVNLSISSECSLSPSSSAFDSLMNSYKLDCSISKTNSEQLECVSPIIASPCSRNDDVNNFNFEGNLSSQMKKQPKCYKPVYRSGSYAILIALLENFRENQIKPLLTKEQLIERAQPHCEESFVRPKPDTYYTAWSSMSKLITKGLVNKTVKKKTYYNLTENGIKLASDLLKESIRIPTLNDIIFNDTPQVYASSNSGSSKNISASSPITVSPNNNGLKSNSLEPLSIAAPVTSLVSTSSSFKSLNEKSSPITSSNMSILENNDFNLSPNNSLTNIDSIKKWTSSPMAVTVHLENSSNKFSSTASRSGASITDSPKKNTLASFIDSASVDKQNKSSSSQLFSNDCLKDTSKGSPVVESSNQDQDTPGSSSACSLEDTLSNIAKEFPKGSFDVILLIDKNETSGLSKKNDPTMVQFKKFPDLKHEYRSLKVGDFLWIARHRVNNEELVLPYIIERKRMDDLGASIKDGRFHEQKFRLKKCGLKHVLYLIENYGKNKHVGLPLQALRQALANTKVQDGFKIHMTDSLTHSTRFLAMMTKRLTLEFKDQSLVGCNHEQSPTKLMTYEYFSKTSMKTKKMSVMETFVKMLVQLKGMSLEKALAVTNKFKTLRCIIEAYKQCGQREGQLLLANLKYGDLNRNVGPTVSKSVYDLFTERSSE